MYLCLKCNKTVESLLPGMIRCPGCGSKVFSKMREPIAKTVKAV